MPSLGLIRTLITHHQKRFFSIPKNCTTNELIERLLDKKDFTEIQDRLAQEFKQQPQQREKWLLGANWDWETNNQLHALYKNDSKPVEWLTNSRAQLKSLTPLIPDPNLYSPDKLFSTAPFPTLQLILAIARKNPSLLVQYPALKDQA
ncbi:hypothetical protein DID73_01740 [Candidatus Marinamargulisbacteria bacterium SCGC AG-343-K17]|nr:hypothetical protein DID73_01740 [Candidatus Marinamargulisbacteria bacterium SCGC AG-343-K17]